MVTIKAMGIGRWVLSSDPMQREALSWFDEKSDHYLTPEEQAAQECQRTSKTLHTAWIHSLTS
ncbi:hypothetical protein [Leptothermofonsia sp. ETS-13]|uniref:hypothetical protein n=1 Tax=Leptothermofonsia sp. ETS-13 TaxID=3035696 RepID=UPI003B9E15A9